MKKQIMHLGALAVALAFITMGCADTTDSGAGTKDTTDTVVNLLSLDGKVTAPAKDAAPVTTAIDTAQYTGTVAWQTSGGAAFTGPTFAAATVYKALVTLSAKSGYTFTGVATNSFSYSGATVTNAINSGVVTVSFPGTENPGTGEPGTENPGTENPGTENPGTENPGTENPGTENPGTENPGTENPGTENPGTENPGTENPGTENPGTENPGTGEPGTENPGTENPGTENPGTENPGTENPGTENPGTENPGTENPGTENPGTENPGTENPGTENPGSVFDTLPTVAEGIITDTGKPYLILKNGTGLTNLETTVINKVKNGARDVVNLYPDLYAKMTALDMTFKIIIDNSEWDGVRSGQNFVVDSNNVIYFSRAYLLDDGVVSGAIRNQLGSYLDTISDPIARALPNTRATKALAQKPKIIGPVLASAKSSNIDKPWLAFGKAKAMQRQNRFASAAIRSSRTYA